MSGWVLPLQRRTGAESHSGEEGSRFATRYLVHHEVSLTIEDQPVPVQSGIALARWSNPEGPLYITSTGPLTGDRSAYSLDTIVAYMLTRPPEGAESIKYAECSSNWPGHLDQILAEDAACQNGDYVRERTAGWLFTEEQPDTVPVFRCLERQAQSHFASSDSGCEGLGEMEFVLGYGLKP